MTKRSYPDIYKGSFYISVSIHIIVVISFLVINRSVYKHTITIGEGLAVGSINVDVVGLPNILKKDLNLLQEQRAKEAGAKRLQKKDQMVLPDQRKIKKARQTAIENIRRSVAYEKTYLEKLKIIKGLRKSVDIGRITDSAEKSTGTGSSDTTSDIPSNPYFITLKDLIKSYWKVPHWMDTEGLNTLVVTKINASGEIYYLDTIKSSGNRDFDNLALSAIKSASPFPTPPILVKETLENGIVFSFP